VAKESLKSKIGEEIKKDNLMIKDYYADTKWYDQLDYNELILQTLDGQNIAENTKIGDIPKSFTVRPCNVQR
jgi:hypothetical protein